MAVQTYCDRDDLDAIVSKHGIDAMVDDDQDGLISSTEETYVVFAIERAATQINMYLQRRYKAADVVNNEWLKGANAAMAVCLIVKRRANPSSPSLEEECDDYMGWLDGIKTKEFDLPNQSPSVDMTPTVSNFRPELFRSVMKPRVSRQESTGTDPDKSRLRKNAVTRIDLGYW